MWLEHVKKEYEGPIWCFASSFGGYLAALYHQRHPEAFEKIMLRSPALKMDQALTANMKPDKLERFMKGEKVALDFQIIITSQIFELRHKMLVQIFIQERT